MGKNKTAEIAAMFGQDLDEPFKIKRYNGEFTFKDEGVLSCTDEEYAYDINDILIGLIMGKEEIVAW